MLKPPGYFSLRHQVNIGPDGFARTTGLFYYVAHGISRGIIELPQAGPVS